MKNQIKFDLLFIILLTSSMVAASVAEYFTGTITINSSGRIVTIGPLHIEGRYIKNSAGEIIRLRGINKHGFEDHPFGHWQRPDGGIAWNTWDPAIVSANLDAMKSWGLNTIRCYSTAMFWIENTQNHRQIVKDLAILCAKRGMYLIYSMWHIHPDAGQTPMPFPPYIEDELELEIIPDEETFINMWRSIAYELKSYPNIIFEFWNEPHPPEGYDWDEAFEDWYRVWQNCIDAVREEGASNVISVHWGWSLSQNLDYPDPWGGLAYVEEYPFNDTLGNIIYSPHLYRGDIHRTVPTRKNCWEYDELKLGLQYCLVEYVLNTLQIPVIIGEIGPNMWETGEELERELAFYNNSLTIFNEWEMGYVAFWWWPTGKHQHLTTEPNYQPNIAGEILRNALSHE